jgi:hypothetical protein
MSAQDELPPQVEMASGAASKASPERAKWRRAHRRRPRLRRAELEAELAKVTVERDEARRMAEIRLRAVESIRHALRATAEGA